MEGATAVKPWGSTFKTGRCRPVGEEVFSVERAVSAEALVAPLSIILVGIYPIAHTFVIQGRVVQKDPQLPIKLWGVLKEARRLEDRYANDKGRMELAKEKAKLGGKNPFDYELGKCEKRSLTAYLQYLADQGLMMRRLDLEDLFAPGITTGGKGWDRSERERGDFL